MERAISPEERIKRAEEIYYRRRNQGVRVSTASVNIGNASKVSLGKKMVVQIIVCILIYCAFWALRSYKSVFSDNVINQTKAVLSYDINFPKLYNQSREYFGSHFNNIIKTNSNQNDANSENSGDESKENKEENSSDDNAPEEDEASGEKSESQLDGNGSVESDSNQNNPENAGENAGIRRWNR